MEPWIGATLTAVSLAFTVPALAPAYYSLILFVSSLRYPKTWGGESEPLTHYPKVSILIAAYNEKFVVGRTLDAVKTLNYPRDKLLVVVADDSTDDTRAIIDRKISELNDMGVESLLSRRDSRQGFKSGALNRAVPMLNGEFVLLLDADSTVTPNVLREGLPVLDGDPNVVFVSYRVGHYNREQNLTTRLFALSLDMGDALNKMGSYSINAPFSFQGGFVLMSMDALKGAGYWSNDTIVDDADVSCKIYEAGWKGIYLSNIRIFSEDPSILEVWKRQAARVAEGWTKCIRSRWRTILGTDRLSYWRRIGLVLMLINPFSALSWIVVTFASALAVLSGLSTSERSVFSNPVYIAVVSIPVTSYFASAIYSLYIQKIMTARNLLLLPLLSYTGYGMFAAISIGFLKGMMGRTSFFFRTPKSGPTFSLSRTRYFQSLGLDGSSIIEGALAILALSLSLPVILKGVWLLGLSLLGFGALTLKSMNLSRLFKKKALGVVEEQLASPSASSQPAAVA